MIYLGIDPGKKGGIAAIDPFGELKQLCPYQPETLRKILDTETQSANNVVAFVEKAQAFPGQGVVGMFNYGKSAGIIEGLLISWMIEYDLVTPARWHAALVKRGARGTTKQRAWAKAQELWPNEYNWFLSSRGKVLDGLVDAALIAEYGRRFSSGKEKA